MSLTFNIGARGRPDKLLETVRLSLENASRPDTVFLICLDDDDETMLPRLGDFPKDERIRLSVKKREDSRGEKYDRCLKEAPADIYLLGTDHSILMTPGWDQIILDASVLFPDGIGVVNVGGMNNASFPKLQAITSKLVDLIGFTYNYDYPFWFIDHELDDIARMIGRFVFADVEVDTVRLRTGNRTQRCRDLKFWSMYYFVFAHWRRELANKIINSPDYIAPDWQKKMLSTWFPVVEARSQLINQEVFRDAEGIQRDCGAGDTPPDPGYIRLKDAAEIKMAAEFDRLKSLAQAA
jgi:hypothetical protein